MKLQSNEDSEYGCNDSERRQQKCLEEIYCFPCSVQCADYTAFNPTVAQLTPINNLSLYIVPPTCSGRGVVIIMKVSNK